MQPGTWGQGWIVATITNLEKMKGAEVQANCAEREVLVKQMCDKTAQCLLNQGKRRQPRAPAEFYETCDPCLVGCGRGRGDTGCKEALNCVIQAGEFQSSG